MHEAMNSLPHLPSLPYLDLFKATCAVVATFPLYRTGQLVVMAIVGLRKENVNG